MPRSLSTDDATLADAQAIFYREQGSGIRLKVTVHTTTREAHYTHDEDLSAALNAMVGASTITAAQRTAFNAVMQALRERARAALALTP